MSSNPYRELADHHFWRRAVAGVERFRLDPVVETRFQIEKTARVATAGSCFAQHISKAIANIGFNYFVTEAGLDMVAEERTRQNYGVFSARYGNIYTSRQLLQLFQECFEGRDVAEKIWERGDGRYVDALRPRICPEGFASEDEVREARASHIKAVRRMLRDCDVFVFTLGLTECWKSRIDGTVYPLAPGVSGGQFDEKRHAFVNLTIDDVMPDMKAFLAGLKRVNPEVKVVLTVSPVPLIATYENQHALVATTYSKSVLRVAAEMLKVGHDWVEYFPSYEIITGNYSDSVYFDADYRGVNHLGVAHAMRCFLEHFTAGGEAGRKVPCVEIDPAGTEIVCDEEAIAAIRI